LTVFDEIYKVDTMRLFLRNGVWYVSLKRGHKKSLQTGDKATAQRIFRKLKEEVLTGKIVALDKDKKITLSDFIKEYLTHRENAGMEAGTVHLDTVALGKLKDFLGNKIMNMITTHDIDQFHDKVLSLGCRPTSLNAYIRHLKTAFKTAIRWGYITRNPYEEVKRVAEPDKYDRILSDDELVTLLTAIDDPDFRNYVLWALFTGCRAGDILSLTWQKVTDDDILIWDKKTKTDREVPIIDDFRPIVDRMRQEYKDRVEEPKREQEPGQARKLKQKEKPTKMVFPRWKLVSSVSHMFHKYVVKAGIKPIKLHGCRHTFGSYLAMAGVAQKAIQELLGHKQMSTTERYMHFHPDRIKQEASKLKYAVNLDNLDGGNVIPIKKK